MEIHIIYGGTEWIPLNNTEPGIINPRLLSSGVINPGLPRNMR